LKGEEGVCHVTEADTPGAEALDVSEEVSSCEAAWRLWVPACAGMLFPPRWEGGFAPVRGGVTASSEEDPLTRTPGSSARKGIWWMPWH
jgi:hypothetical protein